MFGTETVTVVADNAPDKIIVLFRPASSVYVVEDEFVVNAKVVFLSSPDLLFTQVTHFIK